MVKTECSIVRDLLPLYVEDMVSAETAQYVSAHLKACAECQAEFEILKEGDRLGALENNSTEQTDTVKPFKKMM